jgi:hypothetical protein
MIRLSGVELAGMGVSVGIGVLVFVDFKVSVDWILVSVGFGLAHPPRNIMHRRSTKIITTIGEVENLSVTELSL